MSIKRVAGVTSCSAAASLVLLCCSSAEQHPPIAATTADAGLVDTGDAGVPDALAYRDAGAPQMTVSRDGLDLGTVACGKQGVLTFEIANKGKYPFEWSAKLLNALPGVFDVTPARGSVEPRASTTVTLTARVPGDHGIVPLDALLAIASTFNGAAADVSLPVKVVPRGAILRFGTASLDFGKIPIGQSPAQKLTLANDGNASAEVNLILADDPAAPFQRSPSGPVVVPAAGTVEVTETFSPSAAKAWSTGVKLEPAGSDDAFCAPIPEKGAFMLKGEGTTGSVTVLPTSLTFGTVDPANPDRVDCGQAGTTRTVTVTNAGSTPLTWRAQLTAGSSYYNLSASVGTLQGGGSQVINVTPVPIPSVASTEPDLYRGTLSITTDAVNDVQHDILLHETARGAIVVSQVVGSISFGSVPIDQPKSIDFAVSNDGNVPAPVTLSNSSLAFPLTFPGGTGTVTIAPSQSVAAHATFLPHAIQPYADTAKFTVPASLVRCGPLPEDITLVGTGVSGVSVLPASLNFGLVGCGKPAAAPQQLTLTNTGPAMTWTPTLAKGDSSPFTLSDAQGAPIPLGAPRPLAQGASVTVSVVPKPIVAPASTAANAFGDQLTITTTSPGDTVHTVPLSETAQGAMLSYAPVSIATSDAAADHVTFQNFTLTNNGNYPVSYTIAAVTETTTSGNAPNFVINLPAPGSPQQLSAGATQQGVLSTRSAATLVAGKPAQVLGHLTVTPVADSLLCSDPPPVMPLSSN